jgi:hypothetical protein
MVNLFQRPSGRDRRFRDIRNAYPFRSGTPDVLARVWWWEGAGSGVNEEGSQEFGRGNRPLASMRFERWIVEPERCQFPMKRP